MTICNTVSPMPSTPARKRTVRSRSTSFWKFSTVVAVSLAGIAAAHAHGGGGETAYGKPGDGVGPVRIVQVVMREEDGRMIFQPDRLRVRKGEQVRFLLRNNGQIEHEFVVATLEDNLHHMKAMEANPDMRHEEPNARRLDPKQTGEILWRFTKPGTFDFSCLIPGHRQAGMTGTIVVE
jgi:uncharacterized cupredoxin-like copper-binding protein